MIYSKKAGVFLCIVSLAAASSVMADSNVNMNSNTTCNATTPTDPRVAPEGTYVTKNADGSGSTTYTTGEKKPYIVDNGCNNNSNIAPVQPYVALPAPRR